MIHGNFEGWEMGWGIWIVPLAVILLIFFLLRDKRKK
jgi:hypothetical protein